MSLNLEVILDNKGKQEPCLKGSVFHCLCSASELNMIAVASNIQEAFQ